MSPLRLYLAHAGWTVAAYAALAVLLVILPAPASAHGDASWIMQDSDTSWCCGPADCERLPDEDVEAVTPGAWLHKPTGKVFRQGEKGVYPSKRPGFWWCRRGVCFFYEGGGT